MNEKSQALIKELENLNRQKKDLSCRNFKNENLSDIFLVNARKEIQKKRVLKRPDMTEKKFSLINKSQWPFKKKIKQNPFIISTSFGKTITFIIVLFYLLRIKIKGKLND